MNKLSNGLFIALLTLSGCAHEPMVFGVQESVWNRLSPAQQDAVMYNYQRQQEIEQQQAPFIAIIDSATELIQQDQRLHNRNRP
jgi:hypothetical protein